MKKKNKKTPDIYREAVKDDFKSGAQLITTDGKIYVLESYVMNGMWNARSITDKYDSRCMFEDRASYYRVKI